MQVNLRLQNPWWSNRSAIDNDYYLKEFMSSHCKWVPELGIDLRKNLVFSLRGPRQVGKTTYIKFIIKKLLEQEDPHNILYLHSEILENWRELANVLKYYLTNIRRGKAYIFIDEVSSVENWPRAIKFLYDIGLLRNNFILVCGSHSMDVIRGIEFLPGRRGEYEETPDYVMLPMSFIDYIKTVNKKLFEEILSEVKGSLQEKIERMYSFHSELKRLFENYLRAGGFPHAQHHMLSTGHIPLRLFIDFVMYLKGDAHKENISATLLLQVSRRLLETCATPVSWRSLAHGTDYSYHKVQEAVEFLRAAFVVEVVYQPRVGHRGTVLPDFKKDKKVYFIDPFILYSLEMWTLGSQVVDEIINKWVSDPMYRGILIENVVFSHLYRFVRGNRFLEEPLRRIFFARKNQREVDFVAIREDIALLVETKLKRKIKIYAPHQLTSGRKTYNIITTEDELEVKKNLLITPLPELLVSLFLTSANKI